MNYYVQNMMKLELTKEEMACCKKFANFLNRYAEEIDDDPNILCDILTSISDIDNNEKEFLKNMCHVDIEITD